MKKEVSLITTIEEFYTLMKKTRNVRRKIVKNILKNKTIKEKHVNFLRNSLSTLRSIKKEKGKYILFARKYKIKVGLDYEIQELEKDLVYLEQGKIKFFKYLDKIHHNFLKEVHNNIKLLEKRKITTLITDRDGTINNYCERYNSSIQSAYNSVFLTKFASKLSNTIVLSSAPLKDLLKVITTPKNKIIYAGSAGREFKDLKGRRKTIAITKIEKQLLKKLNIKIKQLISKEQYQKFSLIGSGFQNKFGQLTIARQDISNSIKKDESKQFLRTIESIVNSIDPQEKYFSINDTNLDIEIILKMKSKTFDKGNGIKNIIKSLNMKPGNILVCGDTGSDLSLIKACKQLNKNLTVIFVTKNNKLRKEVKKIQPNAIILKNPDTLVTILGKLGNEN